VKSVRQRTEGVYRVVLIGACKIDGSNSVAVDAHTCREWNAESLNWPPIESEARTYKMYLGSVRFGDCDGNADQ
jgi:hypothetical protein